MTAVIASIGNVANLVPKPTTRSTGQINSKLVAKYAASFAEIRGTLYSSSKRNIVDCQVDIFVNPEYQKILAIQNRINNKRSGNPIVSNTFRIEKYSIVILEILQGFFKQVFIILTNVVTFINGEFSNQVHLQNESNSCTQNQNYY